MSATVWEKVGSPMEGMAINSWLVRYSASFMVLGLGGLPIEHRAPLRGAAQELPLVRDAYFVMLRGQHGGKRIVRRGQLQNAHGSLIDFRVAAAAPDDGLQQLAVGADSHFDDRCARELLSTCNIREVDGADTLYFAPPAVQV